jgi:hypothetical protein
MAEHVRFASFPPGWQSEHRAPGRQFFVVSAGSAGIRTSDGETRYFQAGDVLLAEDIEGNGHTSWADADESCLAVIIPLRDWAIAVS